MKKKRHKKKKLPVWMILADVLLVLLLAFGVWRLLLRPPALPAAVPAAEITPEITGEPEPEEAAQAQEPVPEPTPEPIPEGEALNTERQDGVYTFLIAGIDQLSESTDVLMVGKLDSKKHEINIVSIPRDTIINVDWHPRKLNSVYVGSLNVGGNGIDSLMMHIRWITGFEPDCYAIIDLNTFIEVIDAIGGVDFDIPIEVENSYPDIEHGLYIHLSPGPRHLTGREAMALMRDRSGYITADLGRIELQHSFLKACAEQFISLGTIPHIGELLEIVSRNVKTDLSTANIAWFLRQAMLCGSDRINFYTLPVENRNFQGYSYAVPEVSEWLELLNEKLNPYETELGFGNLNIVYCDGKGVDATGYLEGAWYYDTGDS